MEIPPRRVELGLDEKKTSGEVGTAEVGTSEVSPDEIGPSQVSAPEVRPDQVRPSQVGAAEVRTPEVGPDEVSSAAVDVLGVASRPYQFARAQQQVGDASSVYGDVQLHQSLWSDLGETFGLVEREPEVAMDRAGRLQRQRVGQIPEQLMKLPHDREHLEHLSRDPRRLPPVLPAEGNLGDLLARAEAVEDGATRESLLSEVVVNAAAEI
jgi:hypothetical protein